MKKFGAVLMILSTISVLLYVLKYTQKLDFSHSLIWWLFPTILLISTVLGLVRPDYTFNHRFHIIIMLTVSLSLILLVNYSIIGPNMKDVFSFIFDIGSFSVP